MRELKLANYNQTRYPEYRGSKSMPDGTGATPEIAHSQGARGERANGERQAQRARYEIKTSEDKEVDKEAQDTVKEVAKKEAGREERQEARPQASAETVTEVTTSAEVKKTFPTVPREGAIAHVVNEIQKEGKPLEELSTRSLITYYVKLRTIAEEKGLDIAFLSPLKSELALRKINAESLAKAYTKARRIERHWRKAAREGRVTQEEAQEAIELGLLPPIAGGAPDLDLAQIDNPRLRAIGEAINRQTAQIGEDYDVLNNRYGEVAALDGVPQNQKNRLLDQISQAMRRGREAEEERTRQARERAHEEEERRYEERPGLYGDRKITTEEKNQMREAVRNRVDDIIDEHFNRILNRVDVRTQDEFREALQTAGSIEYDDFNRTLAEIQKDAEDQGDRDTYDHVQRLLNKYSQEYKLRELLHNAYFVAETEGSFEDFAKFTSRFASELADLTFLEAPEVETAMRLQEQVLYQIKRENNGTIPSTKVRYNPGERESEFVRRTRELLREANEKGLFAAADGSIVKLPESRLARALSLARGFGMVTLRLPEIVAECRIGAAPEDYRSQVSIPWETISWELNFLDHKIKRYRIGRDVRAILYYAQKEKKKGLLGWWNQNSLKDALALDAFSALPDMEEGRVIDMRTLFRGGGPWTHSGWRSYVSAQELEGASPLLKGNPGLAMKLLWNRYEAHDRVPSKLEFRRQHPEKNDMEFNKLWEKEKGRLDAEERERKEHGGDTQWRTSDVEYLAKSARRIPHVMLRIITDENNKLLSKAERERFLREAYGEDFNPRNADVVARYAQIESDLTLAKENMMKRRRDPNNPLLEKDYVLQDQDFEVIQGATQQETDERRANARRVLEIATRVFDQARDDPNNALRKNILERVGNRLFPFAITTEDVPFGEFRFAQTGGRGLVTRRINDMFQDVKGNAEVVNLFNQLKMYQSPEQIVEQFNKIFQEAQIHDWDRARDALEILAKGVIRFYQKDGITKIPIFGEAMSVVNAIHHRGNSFAQTVWGGNAMEWDSDDIYNFTEQLRQVIDDLPTIQRIRKETGGQWWQAFGKKTKIAVYLLMIFGVYEMMQKLVQEK